MMVNRNYGWEFHKDNDGDKGLKHATLNFKDVFWV